MLLASSLLQLAVIYLLLNMYETYCFKLVTWTIDHHNRTLYCKTRKYLLGFFIYIHLHGIVMNHKSYSQIKNSEHHHLKLIALQHKDSVYFLNC